MKSLNIIKVFKELSAMRNSPENKIKDINERILKNSDIIV